jgi:hypothetical protein
VDNQTLKLALAYRDLILAIKANDDVLTLGISSYLGGNKLKNMALPECDRLLTKLDTRIDEYVARQGKRLKEESDIEIPKHFDSEFLIAEKEAIVAEVNKLGDTYTFNDQHGYMVLNSKVNNPHNTVEELKSVATEVADIMPLGTSNKLGLEQLSA